MRLRPLVRCLTPISLIASLALACGCGGGGGGGGGITNPPPPDTGPVANSPANVVRLLEWAYEHRDTLRHRELFTSDYVFQCSPTGSAGDGDLDRTEETIVARHLFVGGGVEPPASSIELNIDPTPQVLDDSRPGRNPTWHKEVITNVDLTVAVGGDDYRIAGRGRFFVVRGDSAQLPADLVARGFTADPGRWYIEEWDDETDIAIPAASARPAGITLTRNATWCQLKFLYLP